MVLRTLDYFQKTLHCFDNKGKSKMFKIKTYGENYYYY